MGIQVGLICYSVMNLEENQFREGNSPNEKETGLRNQDWTWLPASELFNVNSEYPNNYLNMNWNP